MKKKFLIGLGSISAVVVTVGGVITCSSGALLGSAKIDHKMKVWNKQLLPTNFQPSSKMDYYINHKYELIKYIKKLDYQAVSQKARANAAIKKWIKTIILSKNHDLQKDAQKLNLLNIPSQLKLFMLQNLMEKYEVNRLKKTKNPTAFNVSALATVPRFKDSEERDLIVPVETGDKKISVHELTQDEKKQDEKKQEEKKQNKKKQDKKKQEAEARAKKVQAAKGYVIDKDYNIQRRYSDNSKIEKAGKDDIDINDYVFATDVTYIDWSNQTILDKAIKYADQKLKKNVTTLYDAIKNYVTFSNKKIILDIAVVATNWLTAKIANIIEANRWLKMAVGVADGQYGLSLAKTIANMSDKNLHSWVVSGLNAVLLSGASSVLATSFGVGAVLLAVYAFLNYVGPGNGHSFLENWNDHGLNDWDFQMKNNQHNIAYIAKSYSEDYYYGVTWKVTDGWFSFPELYIKTNRPNQKYTFLSPGTSFNFGNKIKLHQK